MGFFRVGIVDFFGILCPGVLLFGSITLLLHALGQLPDTIPENAADLLASFVGSFVLVGICYFLGFVLRLLTPDYIDAISTRFLTLLRTIRGKGPDTAKVTIGGRVYEFTWTGERYPYYLSTVWVYQQYYPATIAAQFYGPQDVHNKATYNYWKSWLASHHPDAAALVHQAEASVRLMSGSFWALVVGLFSGGLLLLSLEFLLSVVVILSCVGAIYLILFTFKNQRRREVKTLLDSLHAHGVRVADFSLRGGLLHAPHKHKCCECRCEHAGENDTPPADVPSDQIAATAEALAEQQPSLQSDLATKALEFEQAHDWPSAESAYLEQLAFPDLDPLSESKAHLDLGSLYRLLQREADSLQQATLASAAARRAEVPLFLAFVLQSETRALIYSGRLDDARVVVEEGMSAVANDKMYDQVRGALLTLRAELRVCAGDVSAGEADLQTARGILEPMAAMADAAGSQMDLARLVKAESELHASRGDHEAAVSASRHALEIARTAAALPQVECVAATNAISAFLEYLADKLKLAGHHEEAASALKERTELLESVGVVDADA